METRTERFARHTALLKELRGQTIYSLAKTSRDGCINGARYFAVIDGHIRDVTTYVATAVEKKWNDKTGYVPTRAISDTLELAGLRLFDDHTAFKHERL